MLFILLFEWIQDVGVANEFREGDMLYLCVKGWQNPETWVEEHIKPEIIEWYADDEYRANRKKLMLESYEFVMN